MQRALVLTLALAACASPGPASAPTPQGATPSRARLPGGSTLEWGPAPVPDGRAQFELALERAGGLRLAFRFGPDGFERSARAGGLAHTLAVEGHPELGWRLWLDGTELAPLPAGPLSLEGALADRGVGPAVRDLLLRHPGWGELADGLAARSTGGTDGAFRCDLDGLVALQRCVADLCSKPHPAAAPACGWCAAGLATCLPSPQQE